MALVSSVDMVEAIEFDVVDNVITTSTCTDKTHWNTEIQVLFWTFLFDYDVTLRD